MFNFILIVFNNWNVFLLWFGCDVSNLLLCRIWNVGFACRCDVTTVQLTVNQNSCPLCHWCYHKNHVCFASWCVGQVCPEVNSIIPSRFMEPTNQFNIAITKYCSHEPNMAGDIKILAASPKEDKTLQVQKNPHLGFYLYMTVLCLCPSFDSWFLWVSDQHQQRKPSVTLDFRLIMSKVQTQWLPMATKCLL